MAEYLRRHDPRLPWEHPEFQSCNFQGDDAEPGSGVPQVFDEFYARGDKLPPSMMVPLYSRPDITRVARLNRLTGFYEEQDR